MWQRTVIIGMWTLWAPVAAAVSPIIADSPDPYATYPVPSDIEAGSVVVGDLSGYPDTFTLALLEEADRKSTRLNSSHYS